MPFSAEKNKLLAAPLDSARVKEREGGGNKKLSYLETWDVVDRANKVFGFDGWSRETVSLTKEYSATSTEVNSYGKEQTFQVCVYVARVRITVWDGERCIIRDGVGYGDGKDKRPGAAIELAVKEAESDATKRALSTFGYGFGLALYDKTQAHVEDGVDDTSEQTTTEEKQPAPEKTTKPVATRTTAAKAPAKAATVAAKNFPPPKLQTPEEWQKWSRQIAAAIRSAPDRMRATDVIAANVKELKACSAAIDMDAREWAEGLINKRFANTQTKETSREL